MATRATYQFINKNHSTITYYCHFDNYLEGAAQYFNNMLKASSKRDNLAARFLIGNPSQAEFTHSHESHGDTEYRYTIVDDKNLTIESLADWDIQQFKIIYHGKIDDFINKYLPKQEEDHCYINEYGILIDKRGE